MDELIIRMPEDIRNKLLVQLLHKTTKYKDKVEQLILTYLNRIFERGKIPAAYKEHYEKTKARQEQKKEKITAAKENLHALTARSSNAAINAIGITTSIAGTAAEKYQERQIALLTQQEIEEELQYAKLSIYVAEDRPKIAECVANILTYHHQLLILRLNGGDNGYMELARFHGNAIEIFAADKVRGHGNEVDAFVDAAIPKSDSRLYYTLTPHPFKKGFKKALEIDPNTNDLLRRCGPVVLSMLGKVENSNYYSIQEALNHTFIIDPQGHIFTGATSRYKKSYILNSENPYPVILIAPNETTAHTGLEHGTTTIDYKLRIAQLKVLQRFVPEFLVEDLNHDINQTNNSAATDPTSMVHIEERHEYQWSIERSLLWMERKAFIENGTKGLKPVDPSSTQINYYGMTRRRLADIFDAKQARDDVERMLYETTQAFEALKKSEENSTPNIKTSSHQSLKEILAEKNYYLVLAVEPLIIYCEKLKSDDYNKESYYNLAIKALHTAKHIMEATRDTPIIEFTKKEEQDNKTRNKKQLFKKWQELLYFCNDALEITTETASLMQVPQNIHSFVYKNEAKNQSTMTDLMIQATTFVAHSNVLMEQMSAIVKFANYDIVSNSFSQKRSAEIPIQPLIKITKQSTRYLGENLVQTPKTPSLDSSNLITNKKSHISLLAKFSIKEHDSDEEKSDDIEMVRMSDTPNSPAHHHEKVQNQLDNAAVVQNPSLEPDGLMTQYIKEMVHDIKFARKNLIDSQLDKIQFCTEAITSFRNGIFASLGIDNINIGRAFKNDKLIELNPVNLQIATEATRICEAAHQNKQEAYGHRARARSRKPFSTKRRRARKTIQSCENQSITQVTQIIDIQDELNQHYQEAHASNNHFPTVKVLCTFQRFEQSITSIIPAIVANNHAFSSKIEQMNQLAKSYENKLDEENLKLMQDAYKRMEDLLKLKPKTPETLNDVIRYHQIVKNCNRKIVHAANGERISIASSDIMSRFLGQDIDKISANIKSIQKSLINLTRECTTQTDLSQTISITNIILKMDTAKDQIIDVISRLGSSENKASSSSRLIRCDSSMAQDNSIETIKVNVINKIQKLITSIHKPNDIPTPHHLDLVTVIKEELEANLQTLNNSTYLNWGVWIMAIAARASIAYYQSEIIPHEADTIISITDPHIIENRASQLMLDTRKKLLENFHKLEFSMTQSVDDLEDTLESPEEIIDDEIQWASQFNIEEIQKRDHQKAKSKIKKTNEIPSVQLYQDLVKTKRERINPQKAIYEQLVTYAAVFIQNKFNLIHRLDAYLTQLRADYRYFNDLPIGNATTEWFLKKIQSLHKNINDKIQSEKEQRESMVKFEKSLKSRLVIIRIFFQNWKDKTQDPYPKNTLLSSLKEASKARSKEKQRQKAIESAETEEDDKKTKELSPSSMEHAKKKQSIDYVSLKDIDKLFSSLQDDVKRYKENPNPNFEESDSDSDIEEEEGNSFNQQNATLSSNEQLRGTPQLEKLPRDYLERSQRKSVSFDEATQQSILSPKKIKKHRRSNADYAFFQASPSTKAKAQSQSLTKNRSTLSQKKF